MKKNIRIIFIVIITFISLLLLNVNAANLKMAWTNGNDTLYTLHGSADIFLVDEEWRQTGYKNWKQIEEIPWVHVRLNEIYMSQKKDLKVVIVWNKIEKYNLFIFWWDYYLKLEWISTSRWQIDEIISKKDSLEINFDNNKEWTYNLRMGNSAYKDSSIHYSSVYSTWNIQKYTIDWEWVSNKNEDAVKYKIEEDLNDNNINKYWIIIEEEKFNWKYLWIFALILFLWIWWYFWVKKYRKK